LKALSLGAAVNFFDPRNPSRGTDAIWNPGLTTQNFTIALTDKAGKVGTVAAASPRYGTALHQTTGSTTARTHVVLNQIRVPLSDFAAQGLDLANLRKLELRFGGTGLPATGSIQIADVRFQEAASGPAVYTDKLADVPPTVAAAATPVAAPAARAVAAAPASTSTIETTVAPATTAAPIATACKAASAAIVTARVVKRHLTVTGTTSRCATSVRVTVTRVSGARTSKAIRARLASSKWSAAAALAAGKYRVTVAAVAATGAKAAAASTKTVTVK
jgi:hypothetical protein